MREIIDSTICNKGQSSNTEIELLTKISEDNKKIWAKLEKIRAGDHNKMEAHIRALEEDGRKRSNDKVTQSSPNEQQKGKQKVDESPNDLQAGLMAMEMSCLKRSQEKVENTLRQNQEKTESTQAQIYQELDDLRHVMERGKNLAAGGAAPRQPPPISSAPVVATPPQRASPQQGQSQGQWYPKTPMKPPLAFSGERKDEELNTWLRTVPVWVKAKRTLPEDEVVTAASYLEGKAAKWSDGVVVKAGYGRRMADWAKTLALDQFMEMVEARWHNPQEAQRATDVINKLDQRKFKSVRELTTTVESLILVPGINYIDQFLLTTFVRCLIENIRNLLASEARTEYHSFETLPRKALDLEATLSNAQPTSGNDSKKKKSPQEWKKKGAKLMMVDSDGTQTEIDELSDLMDYSEYDGEEVDEGSTLAAVVKTKAADRGKGQPRGQGKTASNQTKQVEWVKAGLDQDVWRDHRTCGACINCGEYGHSQYKCQNAKTNTEKDRKMMAMTAEQVERVEREVMNYVTEGIHYDNEDEQRLLRERALAYFNVTLDIQRSIAANGDKSMRAQQLLHCLQQSAYVAEEETLASCSAYTLKRVVEWMCDDEDIDKSKREGAGFYDRSAFKKFVTSRAKEARMLKTEADDILKTNAAEILALNKMNELPQIDPIDYHDLATVVVNDVEYVLLDQIKDFMRKTDNDTNLIHDALHEVTEDAIAATEVVDVESTKDEFQLVSGTPICQGNIFIVLEDLTMASMEVVRMRKRMQG
ncbi:hypothetical protein CBR_g19706 [Chara braunii]|uniref:CCHC-type domain-containing protein n=1 Tax=Chara braunii TaxID=69332 RepID=A0A388KZ15_CHABU|nr:hypothetical protein CBR_g19706 [Chara braunii]|eukprot:GBG75193.1 hypothetical protein CBR_g19706 [Chara braunii]